MAVHQRFHQIFLNHLRRHTQLRGDGGVSLTIKIVQQKSLARFPGQAFKSKAKLIQHFNGSQNLLWRWMAIQPIGSQSKLGKVGMLDAQAPSPVNQQAIGSGGQIGPWLPQLP